MINSRDPADLHPTVRGMLEQHIRECEDHGVQLLVTSTYRSIDSQDALYAQGRTTPGRIVTNAKGGQSFHQWRVAYDVVPLVNGKPVWDTTGPNLRLWKLVGALGMLCGLEWGGKFTTLLDYPHFQFRNGLSLEDFQQGKTLPISQPT